MLWPLRLIILGQENLNAVDMLSVVRYEASSIIKCLEEKGYDRKTAHSLAFLILLSTDETDFSDFRPMKDGVMFMDYVDVRCNNGRNLPEANYPPEKIRELALKVWDKIVGYNVEFTDEEREVLKKLGVKV